MLEETQKLKDYTVKIDKIMKYVDGDMNRAKQIVQGTLKDFMVVKGKIMAEKTGKSGIFLLFFHKYKYYLVDKFSLVKNNLTLGNNFSTSDSWRGFFTEINNSLQKTDYEKETVSQLNTIFEKEFRPAIISQMIERLENKDLTYVTIQIEKICSYGLDDKDFLLQLDYENISSLDYEEIVKAAIYENISEGSLEKKEETVPINTAADEIEQKKNMLISEGNIIIKGELTLSPIKGKFISEIGVGDNVGVKITEMSPKSMNVIKQLNLITPEGKIKKAKGKVIHIKKIDTGYEVLIQVAPLVVVEVLQEEEVKIDYFPPNISDMPVIEKSQKMGKSGPNTTLLIVVSSVLTAVVILILLVIFVL